MLAALSLCMLAQQKQNAIFYSQQAFVRYHNISLCTMLMLDSKDKVMSKTEEWSKTLMCTDTSVDLINIQRRGSNLIHWSRISYGRTHDFEFLHVLVVHSKDFESHLPGSCTIKK